MINDHQVSLLCYLDNQMLLIPRNFCQWDPQYVLLLKCAWQRILGVGLHSAVSFLKNFFFFFSSDVEHTQACFLKWHKVKRDRIAFYVSLTLTLWFDSLFFSHQLSNEQWASTHFSLPNLDSRCPCWTAVGYSGCCEVGLWGLLALYW